jgi:hypothetical protein
MMLNTKQFLLLRHLLKNTKNSYFNEFFLSNFINSDTYNWLLTNKKSTNNFLYNSKISTLWNNFCLFQQYNEEQLLLDKIFSTSKYSQFFSKLQNSEIKSLNELSILTIVTNKILNSKTNYSDFFRMSFLLEDSLFYQNQLNNQLLFLLDNSINNHMHKIYIQQKTIRGIGLRFFFETIYTWVILIIFNIQVFFFFILNLLERLCLIFVIPIFLFLYFNFLFTDSLSSLTLETVNHQYSIFLFITEYCFTYFLTVKELYYYYDNYFNDLFFVFSIICFYYFIFYNLFFENYNQLFSFDENNHNYLFAENTDNENYENCADYFFEILLFILDFDILNIENNNFNTDSLQSYNFRELHEMKTDIEQCFFFFFFLFFFFQFFFNTGYWDIDFIEDYDEYDGWFFLFSENFYGEDVDLDGPLTVFDSDDYSIFSYFEEMDTSFGFYESEQNYELFMDDSLNTDYKFFSQIHHTIFNFEWRYINNWPYFDVINENIFFVYIFHLFQYDVFYFLILIFFCFFLLYYFNFNIIFEIYIKNNFYLQQYLKDIFFLGWSHSLNEHKLKNDSFFLKLSHARSDSTNHIGNNWFASSASRSENRNFSQPFFLNYYDSYNTNIIEFDELLSTITTNPKNFEEINYLQINDENEDDLSKIKIELQTGYDVIYENYTSKENENYLNNFFSHQNDINIFDLNSLNKLFYNNLFFLEKIKNKNYLNDFPNIYFLLEDQFYSFSENYYNNRKIETDDIKMKYMLEQYTRLETLYQYNYYSGIFFYDFFYLPTNLNNYLFFKNVVIQEKNYFDKYFNTNFNKKPLVLLKTNVPCFQNSCQENYYFNFFNKDINFINSKKLFPVILNTERDTLNDTNIENFDDFFYHNTKDLRHSFNEYQLRSVFFPYFFDNLRFSDNFWLNGFGNWIFLNSTPYDHLSSIDLSTYNFLNKSRGKIEDKQERFIETFEDDKNTEYVSSIYDLFKEESSIASLFQEEKSGESDENFSLMPKSTAYDFYQDENFQTLSDLFNYQNDYNTQVQLNEYLNPLKIIIILFFECISLLFFFFFFYFVINVDHADSFFDLFCIDILFMKDLNFFIRTSEIMNTIMCMFPIYSEYIEDIFILILPNLSLTLTEDFFPGQIENLSLFISYQEEFDDINEPFPELQSFEWLDLYADLNYYNEDFHETETIMSFYYHMIKYFSEVLMIDIEIFIEHYYINIFDYLNFIKQILNIIYSDFIFIKIFNFLVIYTFLILKHLYNLIILSYPDPLLFFNLLVYKFIGFFSFYKMNILYSFIYLWRFNFFDYSFLLYTNISILYYYYYQYLLIILTYYYNNSLYWTFFESFQIIYKFFDNILVFFFLDCINISIYIFKFNILLNFIISQIFIYIKGIIIFFTYQQITIVYFIEKLIYYFKIQSILSTIVVNTIFLNFIYIKSILIFFIFFIVNIINFFIFFFAILIKLILYFLNIKIFFLTNNGQLINLLNQPFIVYESDLIINFKNIFFNFQTDLEKNFVLNSSTDIFLYSHY